MILVQNIGVFFAGTTLFQNVSFRVNKGDRIGLAGKNGAGKSTLLKIIAKQQEASEGEVNYEGDVSVGYLSQDIDFVKGRTVWQEAESAFEALTEIQAKLDFINGELEVRTDYESDEYSKILEDLHEYTERYSLLGGYTMAIDIERILLGLGFVTKDFHRLTEEFSGGWRMRIELAKLLLQNHDVLLLDEPTNHLDIDSIMWLEDFLTTYIGAIILVSHDKQFLDTITTRTIEIAHKKIEDYKANYSKYLLLRSERREKLVQAQKNQAKEIKHTESLISKFKAKASKATMAQSLQKKLDKIDRIEVENDDVTRMNIRFASSVIPGKVVYTLNEVGKSYGEKKIFSKVNILLERGVKVAFVGQNGQGKTTLARMMVGELEGDGTIEVGHNVQVGYFAQNQADVLDPKKTVQEEAEHAATEETYKKVRDLLGTFMFSGDSVEKKTSILSGGERNRLALCKLLLKPFNVLVMDEPTNHLDLQSKEILKQALLKFDGTLILVSHDREFLEGLVDKVYDFREGKVKEFLGGITDYLKQRKVQNFREVEKTNRTEAKEEKAAKKKASQAKGETPVKAKNQKEIQKAEKKIAQLELEIKEMEAGFSSQNPRSEQIESYGLLKKQLEEQMAIWATYLD